MAVTSRVLLFVRSAALLLVLATVTFFVLLTLKAPLNLPSSTFQTTFLAVVVYEGIAVFSKSLGWRRRTVGLVAATTTYILVFAVTKYALVEAYAQNLTEVFWGVGIADDFAFVVGVAVQLALMYRWRGKAQAVSPSFFLLPLRTGFRRAAGGIKALSPFQGAVIAFLLLNAFLSYRAWSAATESGWIAADAQEEARSAANLASDALDAAKEGAEAALKCQ